MDKIIVTGATGFIGLNFISKYHQSNEIIAIVRPSTDISKLSKLLPQEQIIKFTKETIQEDLNRLSAPNLIHLASYSCFDCEQDDIIKLIKSNIEFPSLLLDAFVNAGGKKLLNIGSYWQHYENEYYKPNSLYAASKQAFEDIIEYYIHLRNLTAISLHLFDTYGPNDSRKKIFHIIKEAAVSNKELGITSGNQLFNLTHSDDVVIGLKVALDLLKTSKPGHEKFLLKNKEEYTLKVLINKFISLNAISPRLKWGERNHGPRDFFTSINCVKTLPGWSAKISFEDGLKDSF